jgi:rare lipoprotein A (peptidoglycan hydrolase)
VIRHWRPLAVIILVVLASGSLAASAGPRVPQLAGAPALDASSSWSRDGAEAGVAKGRVSEVAALRWDPTPQPSPTPWHSFATPQVEVPSLAPTPAPAPAPPRVVAAAGPSQGEVTGLATWYGGADGYGPEDVMADGSNFDPNDPTLAAANRWPLGTRLRVCYLERCIDVQVRDRGAFSHALDLSYAAFSQLAPPGTGVITVTISRVS